VLTRAADIIGVLRIDNAADDPGFVVVKMNESMLDVLTAFRSSGAALAVVTDPDLTGVGRVIGVITKDKVADAVADSVQVYPQRAAEAHGGSAGSDQDSLRAALAADKARYAAIIATPGSSAPQRKRHPRSWAHAKRRNCSR
jgi:hypothetical protein